MRAVYRVRCQTGPVVFLAERVRSYEDAPDFVAETMPVYVAAEAEHIGCGKLELKMPHP
ncbi:hypothetical protein [Streptomyces sp. SYSU K217416]